MKKITEGSGNVFADIGVPGSEQELLKAKLTLRIFRLLKDSGLPQKEAGKVLGISQSNVSLLMNNRAGNFSVGKLMEFLAALGQDVDISVKASRKEHGQMSVTLR